MTVEASTRKRSWVLIVGAAVGTVAAFVLTVEKVRVLKDPTYVPSCSINPILSCGSVMTSAQAEAFGFPNPLLGLVGFPVVGTVGVAMRTGTLPLWLWRSLQAGVTLAVAFVFWLTFQSLYRIGALCPYCLAVWAVMPFLFTAVTSHNLTEGHLGARGERFAARFVSVSPLLITFWVLAVVTLIAVRFWDYWSTLA